MTVHPRDREIVGSIWIDTFFFSFKLSLFYFIIAAILSIWKIDVLWKGSNKIFDFISKNGEKEFQQQQQQQPANEPAGKCPDTYVE